MWKSLRIGALLALAAVGALKLAQHEAADGQMQRVGAALAPAVRLSYATVAGALDGRVVLESPRLEVTQGPARGAVLRANRAEIESPGLFWLVARVFERSASVPDALDIRLEGASLSHESLDRYAGEGWFGATSLVPFESVGCEPVAEFSARDYARMGLAPRAREDTLHYSYDAAKHVLTADVESTAAPFSTINAHIELSSFEPAAWLGDARAAKAQRIEQLSLTYLDGGYLARRNRFCAQLTGTDAAGYAARQVAAVRTFLAARGVVPGDEVTQLYRKLVAEGGSAEISSLPEPSFVPADAASSAPDDVLRRLNVTVRHDTAPPILMRLAFAEPTETPAEPSSGDVGAMADTAAAASAPIAPPADTMNAGAADTTNAGATDTSETVAAREPAREPASAVVASTLSEGLPLLSVANAAPVPIEMPRVELPVAPQPEDIAAAAQTVPTTWTSHPSVDPRDAAEAIPASAPPPAPGTTDALVWQAPTIERLPRKVAAAEYVVVPTASLAARVGVRVRLLTAGGKTVEGRLRRLDGADAVVSIARDGGTAEMRIPQAGIREVAVRRSSISP